jgi:hypothetical protein
MRLAIRIALLAVAAGGVLAPAASAGVIVWRSTTSSAIWEAGDDGTAPHIVGHGSAPYISPDATQLAYGNAQNQLTITSLATPTQAPLVTPGVWNGFATWSPNSKQLGAQIGTALVAITPSAHRQITLAHADHGWLAFNPTSKLVALDGYNDSTNTPDLPLQTEPTAGGTPKLLQKTSPGATGICWSAKNAIAFAVSASTGPVFTEIVKPGGKAKVAARSAYNTYPDGWSDDGKRLLIEEDEAKGVRLGYLTASTGKIHLLSGFYTFVQAISHDGTRALVTGHDATGRFVGVVSLSSGHRLTTLRNAVDPSWTS